MAEKPKKKEEKKPAHHSGGISFGLEVVLFVVAIFILWVLTGGNKDGVEEKPFITPLTDPVKPGVKYGPNENPYGDSANY
jgi:hypothetical protein